MKTILNILLVSILMVSVGTLLAAPTDEAAKTLEEAVSALNNVIGNPEEGIPQSLISQSEGIVILRRTCQVAAGAFNGPGSKGVALINNEDGSWSKPFFVTLREGRQGFHIGAQTSDIVMLFKDREDIIDIHQAEITLGGNVEVAAGPVNSGSSSITSITFEKDVYSYHRHNGLYSGLTLVGAVLSYSKMLGDSSCGAADIFMDEIFYQIGAPNSDVLNTLASTEEH
jgi:lipid-binding SYLF domain-containing protein